MHKPKISIIIPAYNCSGYITKCLDSLICQTYKNLEIICINDGSTDSTLEILEQYAEKDERIKVLTQKNCGASVARNRGVENSTGDYISYIDGDDWVLLTLYQTFVQTLERVNKWVDIWMFNVGSYEYGKNDVVCRTFFDSTDWKNHTNEDTIHTFSDCKRPFTRNLSAANKIYRREFIEKNGIEFPTGLKYEDQYYAIKSFLRAESIIFTEQVLYRYRNYEKGSATTEVTEKVFDIFKIVDMIEAEIDELNLYEEYKYALFQYKYTIYLTYYNLCPDEIKDKYYEEMKNRLIIASGRNLDLSICKMLRNYNAFELIKISDKVKFDEYIK